MILKLRIVAILLFLICADVHPELINGSFESDAAGTTYPEITGWTVLGKAGPDSNYIITDVLPHGGIRCLKFTKYSGYVATKPANAIRIRPDTDYTFRFWVRCDEGTVSGNCRIEIYKDVNTWSNSVLMAKTFFTASPDWKEVTCFIPATALVTGVNVDMLLGIRLDKEGTTIYIDDVTLTEKAGGPNIIINTAAKDLIPGKVNHRLSEHHTFSVTADAYKVIRPVNRKVMGVSFHTLSGTSNKAPFNNIPPYNWFYSDIKTKQIQDLNLPITRIYNIRQADVWNDVKTGLDKAAELAAKVGIDEENMILEFDPQDASAYLKPSGIDSWQSHVQYSMNRGYKFRYWEIGNEVYLTSTFPSPADYSEHVKGCATAIRTVQPEARIGISVISDLEDNYGWSYYLAEKTAGSYDFVCPHFYSSPLTSNMDNAPVEELALETNFRMFERIQKWNALLKFFNPDRPVEILDTEWALTGKNASGDAEITERNTNIVGSLHRAVRLIYYIREGIVGGANQWLLTTKAATQFGFYLIPVMATTSGQIQVDQVFVPYYLNYYFGKFTGDYVVDITGTCPYYSNNGYSGPEAPVLITRSSDGKKMYIILVNGTQSKNIPCNIAFKGFNAEEAKGKVLNQSDLNASPLISSESEVMSDLAVLTSGGSISFQSPAHSVCFVSISGESHLTDVIEVPGKEEVLIVPNPCKPENHREITFRNLMPDSTVDLYFISGQKITSIKSDESGLASYNLRNTGGQFLNPGIYIASVADKSGVRKAVKFTVE